MRASEQSRTPIVDWLVSNADVLQISTQSYRLSTSATASRSNRASWDVLRSSTNDNDRMQRVEVEVFNNAVNRPVLRMPGRRFPGVLIQGDTLSILAADARHLARALTDVNLPAADDAAELSAALSALLEHYADTLASNGTPLPYETPAAAPADQRLHVAGWVQQRDGRRFLEVAATFVDYDFDDDDWLAIGAQLEQAHHSAHYSISGRFELTADLSLTEDGGHLSVNLRGGPNRYLQIQLETLFTALTHPAAAGR